MQVLRSIAVALFCLLALSPLASAFTWSQYEGTSQWRVEVTEDLTDCEEGVETDTLAVTMQHKGEIVDIPNLGHGTVRGGFTGNTLRLPARTIPDGVGESDLDEAVVTFTPDCKSFSTTYGWHYKDDNYQCSGTTRLKGTRLDGTTCPAGFAPKTRALVSAAREDPDLANKERRYQEILKQDPTNFWANWDLAELKLKQGKYNDYFRHIDKAASNEKNFQETREAIKKEAANTLGLTRFPTDAVSPLLRAQKDELKHWQQSFTYNEQALPPPPAEKESWPVILWRLFVPDPSDLPSRAAGLPPE